LGQSFNGTILPIESGGGDEKFKIMLTLFFNLLKQKSKNVPTEKNAKHNTKS
jgi:hypothetical protein